MSYSGQVNRDAIRAGAHDLDPQGLSGTVEDATDHLEWDAFVERTVGGDLVQSSAWARLKRTSGMEVHRIVVRLDGPIVAGVQLLARRLPLLGAVAYAPYGPVVAPDAPDAAVALLVEHITKFCRVAAVRALFVQPPRGGARIAAALRSVGFEPTQMDVAPCETVRIDLDRTPAQLLEGMSKHTRRDVRQSFREPINVRFATRADLRSFYELYCCTAARQAFTPLPFRYLEHMWDELHPGGRLEILIADVNGVDVSGNMISCFGDTITGRWLGFDATRVQQRLRPNEALIWAAMNWARARGCRWLDVGGVNRAIVASADQVPLKLRFGGTAFAYPEPLKLIVNPVARRAYRVVGSNDSVRRLRRSLARRARVGALKGNSS
jgi:lipid II:glycine glycyltransferase (peptidoglycan interpeptide bridge formation enzyme)